MSTFSPRNSVVTMRTRAPRAPTQAPTGSTLPSLDQTAVLGPMARLTGTSLDLDDPIGDLGHLELEEALDEPGMAARDDDLRTLAGLADLDDVCLESSTVVP